MRRGKECKDKCHQRTKAVGIMPDIEVDYSNDNNNNNSDDDDGITTRRGMQVQVPSKDKGGWNCI